MRISVVIDFILLLRPSSDVVLSRKYTPDPTNFQILEVFVLIRAENKGASTLVSLL